MKSLDGAELRLDYVDPLAPRLDPDLILRRSRRSRLLRRTAIVTGCSIVASVVALGIVGLPQLPQRPVGDPSARLVAAAQKLPSAAQHRPLSRPVLLPETGNNWQPFAWVSAPADVCLGVGRAPGVPKAPLPVVVNCIRLGANDLARKTDAVLGPPIFLALPIPTENGGAAVALGIVRGSDVATVQVTFRNRIYEARVVPLAALAGHTVGAYSVQVPVSGLLGYGSGDVQSVLAYDASGNVRARL